MILFSDFDHTLYHQDDLRQTAKNFRALSAWRANGHKFCITTGRSYVSVTTVMPILKEICDYFILDGGSLVLSPKKEIINAFAHEESNIRNIEEIADSLSVDHALLYFTPDSESLSPIRDQVTKIRLWFKEVNNVPVIREKFQRLPIQIFTCKGENNSRHKELKPFNTFIEFIPNHSGKDKAIAELIKIAHIPKEDIIVVGDDENDAKMIKDFDGYMIEGCNLSLNGANFKTTPSVATLIYQYLDDN